jgi:OTU domain-containing protein 3
MYQTQGKHGELRTKICDFILENVKEYQFYIQEPMEKYIKRMRKNGVYGGNLELVAASKVLNVGIAIHQVGQDIWYIGSKDSLHVLHVAYHNWEHYSSITNQDGTYNIIIKMPSSASDNKKSWWIRDASSEISNLERMILNSTNLNDGDISRIRELMLKYKGNPSDVIDHIYEEIESESTTLVGFKENELQQVQQVQQAQQEQQVQQVRFVEKQKKLSKREKKDVARRLKNTKKSKTATDKVIEKPNNISSILDGIGVLSI